MDETELIALAGRTRDIYERNAVRFDAERGRTLIEKTWLDRFLELIPPGGAILDVGCGSGEPIAQYFIAGGHPVSGLDFSQRMLDIAAARFPGQSWICADMCDFALGRTFDGIVAWHSFFHLTPEDQPWALERFAAHLPAGGALLLTVGPAAGTVTGHVGDDEVYHASLDPEDYQALLGAFGMEVVRFVPEDPECDFNSPLLARKKD